MTELIDYVFDAYPCKHRSTGVPLGNPDFVIAISTTVNNPATAYKLAYRHTKRVNPDETWVVYLRDVDNPKYQSLPVPGGSISWVRPWTIHDAPVHAPEWNQRLTERSETDELLIFAKDSADEEG